MSNFSTEIWTPGLTPNPSQQKSRELVMAANKTSKKSGGWKISLKKSTDEKKSKNVFHPEDSEAESGFEDSGADSETETASPKRSSEVHRSALPHIRAPPSPGSSNGSGQNSPVTPKKNGNILYRIFHPNDEGNTIIGTSRRSYHSSDESDSEYVDSSDAESDRSSINQSSLPRVRPSTSSSDKQNIFRKNSVSSTGSTDDDDSGSENEQKKKTRGSIFKDLMKINRSSSHSDVSEDEDHGTNKILKGLSIGANKKNGQQPASPASANQVKKSVESLHFDPKSDGNVSDKAASFTSLPRSDSEVSLSEKYGKKEEVLGRGANAVVRLCQPVNSDKKYAIKEFRKRRSNETQKEYVKKLVAEFCISSTLEHENVVKTVDLIQDEKKQWCVVMEYCESGDLYSRIHSGTLTEANEINCYFKQLLLGVKYLHEMGVAHRDLKPENLLLTRDGKNLKITDFGVSEVFRTPFCTATKKAKGLCGSGPYIAPEEFEKKEYNSDQVDLWACGIIYYVLAFQSIPWRAATLTDTRYKYYAEHLGKFWPFDRLPPAMRKLMYGMLEPNPEKRLNVDQILDSEYMKSLSYCSPKNSYMPANHTHVIPKY
ncbi:serine/threonine-protein kinase HAL4/sat4 [Nowakowskiella sp. JEL0407]|nr:serine/threonine-protein kinase HAL4/sat4 [Nowakowskiella sp. JEL0407]